MDQRNTSIEIPETKSRTDRIYRQPIDNYKEKHPKQVYMAAHKMFSFIFHEFRVESAPS